MTKRVIVIGNGFDLNLGLKTSYSDFIKSTYFMDKISRNKLFQFLHEKYMICNWVDIEIALFEYAEGKPNNNQFCRDFNELRRALKKYLSNIDVTIINPFSNAYKFLMSQFEYCMNNRGNVELTIINLNYTRSVQEIAVRIQKKYKITHNRIPYKEIQIHGNIHTDDIILGYDGLKSMDEKHVYILKKSSDIYESPTDILYACDELFIYGFSLGESDESVFKPFFEIQTRKGAQRKNIIIYYYKQQGLKELKMRLDAMISNYFGCGALALRNNVEYVDVTSKSMWSHIKERLGEYWYIERLNN